MLTLIYLFRDVHGKPITADERMDRFARRYAARFFRKYKRLPHGRHPFPNMWDGYTFVVDYGDASKPIPGFESGSRA